MDFDEEQETCLTVQDKPNLKEKIEHGGLEDGGDDGTSPDDVISSLGGCGRFQFLLGATIQIMKLVVCWGMVGNSFFAFVPAWDCITKDTGSNLTSGAITTEKVLNASGMTEAEKCAVGCTRYEFHGPLNTVVNEFDLVCDLSWVTATITSVQMVGMCVGSLVSGQLSDAFGRKAPIFSAMAILGVSNLVAYFSINWVMFAVCKFFIGVASAFFLTIYCTIQGEWALSRWRSVLIGFPSWALESGLLALVAFLVPDWKKLTMAVAILSFLFLVPWIWTPESFRWYITKGKYKQAERAVARVARWNKRGVPRDFDKMCDSLAVQSETESSCTFTLIALFRTLAMLKLTLPLMVTWLTMGFIAYGINFGIKKLSGNIFLNLFIFSIASVPSKLMFIYLQNRFGRRKAGMFAFLLCLIGGSVVGLAQHLGEEAAMKEDNRKSDEDNTAPYNTRSGRGRGRRSEYKVYVGWQHYSKNSFRVVTNAKGGGTRTITCKADEDITVEDIIKQAKKFFFKDGNSYFGKLETMSVCLVNPSGETIVEFTDTNGEHCSYSNYLKAYGMYPSQCHLYMRTQTESLNESSLNSTESSGIYHVNDSAADSDTGEMSQIQPLKKKLFLVNGQQVGTLDIVYGKVTPSLYSSTASTIYCKSYKTCISLASNNDINDGYDVFEDGFTVRGVSKCNKQYLVENESNYIFNGTIKSSKNDFVIVNGPDEIHGTEADDNEHLLLGALTLYHNQSFMYKWYRDADLVESGLNRCLLRKQEPGVYTAEIVCSDSLIVRSFGVSVSVSDQHDRITEQSQLFSFPSDAQHESRVVQSQLVSVPPQQQLNINVSQSHQVSVPSESPQYHERCAVEHPRLFSVPSLSPQEDAVEQSHLVSMRQSQLRSVPPQLPQVIAVEQPPFFSVPSQSPQKSSVQQTRLLNIPSRTQQQSAIEPSHLVSIRQSQQLCVPPQEGAIEQSDLISNRQSQLLSVSSQLPQESAEQQPQLCRVPSQSLQESSVKQSHVVGISSPLPRKSTYVNAEQPHLLRVPSQSPQESTVIKSQLVSVPSKLQQERTVSHSQLFTVPSQLQQEIRPSVSDLSFPSVSVPKINILDINIGEEIGRGAFGVVFKADWLGTLVAVKEIVVRRMKISKPVIERELQLHSRVRHPNIVLLMAYATKIDKLYLVSELVVGDTLDDILFGDERERLCMNTKLNISKKVSQSVAYLHCQRPLIVHRDIKPENIMVSTDFRIVKLCDMGLSKLKTMNTIMPTLAGGSAQPGTPAYQAPEVLLHHQSANPNTDVWALCCTLVEVFCETPIWEYHIHEDADPVKYTIERMRLEAQPDGLQGLASKVNAAIYSLLDKGLSYRPVERPDALEIVKVFGQ